MYENLTKLQVKQRVQDSVPFALGFIVDNQPDLVISELKNAGAVNVSDVETAYNSLIDLYNSAPVELAEIIKSIPYNNAVANYTGGFESLGMQTKAGGLWGNIFALAGGLFSGIGNVINANASQDGTTLTPAQIEEQKRLKEEEEAKKKALNQKIMIGGGVVLLLIIIVLIYSSKKK